MVEEPADVPIVEKPADESQFEDMQQFTTQKISIRLLIVNHCGHHIQSQISQVRRFSTTIAFTAALTRLPTSSIFKMRIVPGQHM